MTPPGAENLLVAALRLPPDTRVDQRVSKKLLLEQGAAPTAADRRNLQDGLEELLWVAALKPGNVGVPAFRDPTRDYAEVAVLSTTLRASARVPRLHELIHRAIPYPVVLVSRQSGGAMTFSLAQKRRSEAETDRTVLEGVESTTLLAPDAPAPAEAAFLASLAVTAQPARDLFALYGGWLERVVALEAARVTGQFSFGEQPGAYRARREALDTRLDLQRQIARLRAQAVKERQVNRRVELNLSIRQLETRLAETTGNLLPSRDSRA